jgi:hypothetical protein
VGQDESILVSGLGAASALVRVAPHELLHKAERRTMTTATVRETGAEAVAFIVGQSVGLEMGTASSDYIQMYAGNAALLAESLEVIQHASAVILAAIWPKSSDSSGLAPAAKNQTTCSTCLNKIRNLDRPSSSRNLIN